MLTTTCTRIDLHSIRIQLLQAEKWIDQALEAGADDGTDEHNRVLDYLTWAKGNLTCGRYKADQLLADLEQGRVRG